MLHYFTWQQFSIAALILSFSWYASVILLFYRKELHNFLSGKPASTGAAEPLAHVWDEDFEDEPLAEQEENLLGKPVLPEGMSRLAMSQFGFAPAVTAITTEEAAGDDDRDTRLGIVPDVLEELKSIFHILESEDGNKADFISLFGLVSAKYPKIRNTPNQQAINDYIRENLPFDISDEELDNIWI
jgi:hypothetical protein